LSPLWGLGATHAVHLKLIAKRVVDFLLVIVIVIAALKFCFKTCVAMKFVDDNDDDDDDDDDN